MSGKESRATHAGSAAVSLLRASSGGSENKELLVRCGVEESTGEKRRRGKERRKDIEK